MEAEKHGPKNHLPAEAGPPLGSVKQPSAFGASSPAEKGHTRHPAAKEQESPGNRCMAPWAARREILSQIQRRVLRRDKVLDKLWVRGGFLARGDARQAHHGPERQTQH